MTKYVNFTENRQKIEKSSFTKSDNSAGIGRKYDFWPEIHRIRLAKHSWTIIHTYDIILHHFDFESKIFFFESKNVDFQKISFFGNPFFVNSWCHILTLMWVYTYILGFFYPTNSGPYLTSFLGIHGHFGTSGHFRNPLFSRLFQIIT